MWIELNGANKGMNASQWPLIPSKDVMRIPEETCWELRRILQEATTTVTICGSGTNGSPRTSRLVDHLSLVSIPIQHAKNDKWDSVRSGHHHLAFSPEVFPLLYYSISAEIFPPFSIVFFVYLSMSFPYPWFLWIVYRKYDSVICWCIDVIWRLWLQRILEIYT